MGLLGLLLTTRNRQLATILVTAPSYLGKGWAPYSRTSLTLVRALTLS